MGSIVSLRAKMEENFKVPATEIVQRIERVQKQLQDNEVDGLLIIQRVDLFYFSGTAQNAYLYIPADGAPLLLVKRYMPRVRRESSVANVIQINSVKELPWRIADFFGTLPNTIGLEYDVIPVREFNFYERLFPEQQFIDASSFIYKARMIKSDWEIAQMEKSAELSRRSFEYVIANLRPDYTEIEFAGMIETFARRLGHGAKLRIRDFQAEMNTWHVLSGRSGGLLGSLDSPCCGEGPSIAFPCGGGRKKLAPNEPIMIDLGSVLEGYHFDETRMFAIESMPKKAYDACQAVIEIHNDVLDKVKPGISLDELFQISVNNAESLGYAENYLGPPGYKAGFIGHGVGLELVEPPFISKGNRSVLQPGMVFALEPKIVVKNEFAAGIESDFLVTETGHRLLSQVPVKVFIC